LGDCLEVDECQRPHNFGTPVADSACAWEHHLFNTQIRAALDLQIVTHPTATWRFNRYYDAQSIRHSFDKGEATDSTAG
jgi:hypothetical protein